MIIFRYDPVSSNICALLWCSSIRIQYTEQIVLPTEYSLETVYSINLSPPTKHLYV